jgi:hypothetical protein
MAEITLNGETFKLKCGMNDCENNMHSFNTSKTLQKKGIEKGCCVGCRSALVDWERIHKRDISDFNYLNSALKLEMIRNIFWTIKEPTEKMKDDIRQNTTDQLSDMVHKRLRTTLSKPKKDNDWDGRQTPFDGKLIYWAQHATGTCCRKCVEEWYGIDANAELSDSDYDYLEQVVTKYLLEKSGIE